MELEELTKSNAFAKDPSYAEKAGTLATSSIHDEQKGALVEAVRLGTIEKILALFKSMDDNSEPGFKTVFRPDAKIWDLYLIDAERVAKERAELWKTWLDSLLIFAGLFAGVVSSFVIDATDDPQRNNPTAQSSSTSSLWTTGLWFCSLIITIFGAVMGVLAKTWISNFIPVSNRREAEDAHQRLMLDKQAKRWRLERVILVIPLLVQIASFLFAFGFAIQSFSSNTAIGVVVTILVGIGTAAYLLSTITAALSPRSFPFRTPLSDLLVYLENRLTGSINEEYKNLWSKHSVDEELAEIWLEKLIKSPNTVNVNESVAELAQQWTKIGDHWRIYFCRPDVLHILLGRLKEYMISGSSYKPQAQEELCSYIDCMMHLVHQIETKPDLNASSALRQILSESLGSGGPLHRWNIFKEDIRPLAFCVRAHIMILLKYVSSQGGPVFGDITPAEVDERPWEGMFYHIRPDHRFKFFMAASRGLLEGQRNVQVISAHALSLILAKASASEITSEWSGDVPVDMLTRSERLGQNYLAKLLARIVEEWETMKGYTFRGSGRSIEFLDEFINLNVKNSSDSLSLLLSHPDGVFRIHGVRIIMDASLHFNSNSVDEMIQYSKIDTLCKLMISDKDEQVRETLLNFILKLWKTDELKMNVEKLTTDTIKGELDESNQISKLCILRSLSNIMQVDNEFFFAVANGSISQLIKLTFTGENSEIRSVGKDIVKSFLGNNQFRDTTKVNIQQLISASFSDTSQNTWGTYCRFFHLILDFLEEFDFLREEISPWIKAVIIDCAFKFSSYYYRERITTCAEKWISDRAEMQTVGFHEPENDFFQTSYNSNVSTMQWYLTQGDSSKSEIWENTIDSALRERLSKELMHSYWGNRCVASRLCRKVSWVSELIRLGIKDEDGDVQSEALGSLKALLKSQKDDLAWETMSSSFITVIDTVFSEESSYNIKVTWIEILSLLFKKISFHDGVRKIIEEIVKCSDSITRCMALNLLTSLVSIPSEVISPSKELKLSWNKLNEHAITGIHWLELLTSLKHCSTEAQEIGLKLMTPIIQDMRSTIRKNISDSDELQLHQLIHKQLDIKATFPEGEMEGVIWVRTLGFLAAYFPEEMKNALPIIQDIVRTTKSDGIRSAAMKALAPLAQTDQFKEQISESLQEFLAPFSELEEVHYIWINVYNAMIRKGDVDLALKKLFDITIVGTEGKFGEYTRTEALRVIASFASIDDVKLHEALKSMLAKISTPVDLDWTNRLEWVRLYTVLAQKKFQHAIQVLVNIANEDIDADVRLEAVESLTTLAKKDERIREILIKAIPFKYLDSVFAANNYYKTTLAWVKLINLLPSSSEFNYIPKLVEASVIHNNEDVRLVSVESLRQRFNNDSEFTRSVITEQLSKHIELGLKNVDMSIRRRVVSTIEFILSSENSRFMKPTLNSLIPHLLKIIMNEDGDIQSEAELAFDGLAAYVEWIPYSDANAIIHSSISAIPQFLIAITEKGKDFVTKFAGSVLVNDNANAVVSMAARNIVSVLKGYGHPRLTYITSLELLIHFYKKHQSSKQIIHSAIPDIISTVLYNEVDDVRVVALELIVLVAQQDERCLNEMMRYQQQFITLLESNSLKHSAAQVVSLMAKDKDVRKEILSQIVFMGVSPEIRSFKGYISLLSRLLIDQRLGKEPIDYIIVILVSTLVKQPRLQHLQFQVVSALRYYYSEVAAEQISSSKFPDDLMRWFKLALFGRHATLSEVSTWNSLSSKWLPEVEASPAEETAGGES
ncbi:armadillo-type protein [Cyathus striatus]|nr:armadillo-type protein [Cyathus striatus]